MKARRLLRALPLLLVVALLGANGSATIKAHVQYKDRLYDRLSWLDEPLRPVRHATVVFESGGMSRVAVTDKDGNVSFDVTDAESKSFTIRVQARALNATYDILVSDKRSEGAVEGIFGYSLPGGDQNLELKVTSEPFNVLDVAIDAIDYIQSISEVDTRESLTIVLGGTATGYNKDLHYIEIERALALVDETVLHEIGHWVQLTFSSPTYFAGGPHNGKILLDVETAFTEGWGHYFAGAVRRANKSTRAGYMIIGEPDLFGSEVDFERASIDGVPSLPTQASEVAVVAALWDLIDPMSPGETWDTLENLDHKVFSSMTKMSPILSEGASCCSGTMSLDNWFHRFEKDAPGPSQVAARPYNTTPGTESILQTVGIRFYDDGPFTTTVSGGSHTYNEPNETRETAWRIRYGVDVGGAIEPVYTLWDHEDRLDQDWFYVVGLDPGAFGDTPYEVSLTRPSGNHVDPKAPASRLMDDGARISLTVYRCPDETDFCKISSDPDTGSLPTVVFTQIPDFEGTWLHIERSTKDAPPVNAGYYGIHIELFTL